MGDQDDDRDEYRLEDILAFNEEDLKDYTAGVQQYVAAAMKRKAPALSKLCEYNNVEQSELRQAGFHPTWTKLEAEDGWAAEGTSSVASDSIDLPISIATSSQLRSSRSCRIYLGIPSSATEDAFNSLAYGGHNRI